MLLGVSVIFLPFLGFTSTWNMMINVVCGLLIIAIAYQIVPTVKLTNATGKFSPGNSSAAPKEDIAVRSTDLPFIDHHSNQEPVITDKK
jgi:hypothetical protein